MKKTSYSSPWQHPSYVRFVQIIRRILRPFGPLENKFIAAVVTDHNKKVTKHLAQNRPNKVLLIMPRCVQKIGCRSNVQESLDECLVCGRCPLGDVAAICDQHGLPALVAFRSHIAFDLARQQKPDLIIATACHDRLIKALRNVPEVPALLAPLASMDRMCVNASVDLQWLDEQLTAVTS